MVQHKRGDTFRYLLVMPEADFPDGYFLGWEVASQARTQRGRLVADLAASWADPAESTRTLELFFADTKEWPVGVVEIDVQFTKTADGTVRSTRTVEIEIVKDITLT